MGEPETRRGTPPLLAIAAVAIGVLVLLRIVRWFIGFVTFALTVGAVLALAYVVLRVAFSSRD